MAVNKIDLNSDVGESFGNYRLGMDEKVIPLISSANIACGFHAGDPTVMKRTLAIANEMKIDIASTFHRKMDLNRDKYPVHEYHGRFGASDPRPPTPSKTSFESSN